MYKKLSIVGSILVILASCSKKEGVGGNSTISGVIMVQDIAQDGRALNSKYPAIDKDVNIQYGSSDEGDDAKTNAAGVYSFPYLTDGTYKIYCYSDDSLGGTMKTVKEKTVSAKGSSTTVDTITIYKIHDYNDGDNSIFGIAKEVEFYNGTTKVKDTVTAQDYEIYYRDITDTTKKQGVIDRVRTAYDGTYTIKNIIPGTYELYMYGESASTKREAVVKCTVKVAGRKQIISAPTMYVMNY